MKYFESKSDFTSASLSSPIDLLRFIVACVFLSPIRLILEVSKKIMFTGHYFKKFILNCIYLNAALIILSIVVSIFITKKFYLYGNLLPLPSLIISFLGLMGFYYFGTRFELEVDFDSTESMEDEIKNISEVYGQDESVEIEEEVKIEKPSFEPSSIDSEEDIELDICTDEDFDAVYNEEAENLLKKVPSNNIEDMRRRIEEQRASLRENTTLHPPSVNLKVNYMDVREQEQSKIEQIRKNYAQVDSPLNEKLKDLSSIIRGVKPEVDVRAINDYTTDDLTVDNPKLDLTSYSNDVMSRANKRRATLDSLIEKNNASVMMDEKPSGGSLMDFIDEEDSTKDETNDRNPVAEMIDDIYMGGGMDLFGDDEPFSFNN